MSMQVCLIARPDRQVTGLRRYSDTLEEYLRSHGITTYRRAPTTPVPAPLAHAIRRLGRDVDTFFQTYPVTCQFDQADIYHLTSETLATLLLFTRTRPTIVTVHAFFTYLLRNQPELMMYDHPFHRWFDLLTVRGLRRAHTIIAVSEYVRETLIQHLGIPASRIRVIPEAVDHTVFHPRQVPLAFRSKHGLSDQWQYVLYVGSEQPRKNFLTLIRAFARVRERVPGIRLLKVGQPEVPREREKALTLIRQLGIEDDVILCGHAENDLPLFYNLCQAFVFPSLYEGFGFPPLEAMACGAPVICSNTTSLPEVIGDAALLFDPTDEDALVHHLEDLLRDRTLRQEYRHRGLERARRFDWATTAQNTVEIYKHVQTEARMKHSTSAGGVRP